MNVRTTVNFDSELLKLLKLKAVETSHSVSELLNEIVANSFKEDREDLKVFEERKNEPTISFESFLKDMDDNGRL
jgi:hypothetical protein